MIALAPPIVHGVRYKLQRHYVTKANDGVGKVAAVQVGDPVSGRQAAVPGPDVIVAHLRCECTERDACYIRGMVHSSREQVRIARTTAALVHRRAADALARACVPVRADDARMLMCNELIHLHAR